MKYKYSIEMTPEEVGGIMREVGANMPALLEGLLRLPPMLRDHISKMNGKLVEKEGETPEGKVLRVVWPLPDDDDDNDAPADSDSAGYSDVPAEVDHPPKIDVMARLEMCGLTHKQGLMRTLEVAHADASGVILAERGLSDRPATYEWDGFTIAVNWADDAELHDADDAWYDFLHDWCANYEIAALDAEKEAERRPKLLNSIIGTRQELLIKKYIVFKACACLNRAVYYALVGGLAEDGHEAKRFRTESLSDLVCLADHISANITLVAHGSMPELRVLHDITGKWSAFLADN